MIHSKSTYILLNRLKNDVQIPIMFQELAVNDQRCSILNIKWQTWYYFWWGRMGVDRDELPYSLEIYKGENTEPMYVAEWRLAMGKPKGQL